MKLDQSAQGGAEGRVCGEDCGREVPAKILSKEAHSECLHHGAREKADANR